MADSLVHYNVSLTLEITIPVPAHDSPPAPPAGYHWVLEIQTWDHEEAPDVNIGVEVIDDRGGFPLILDATFSDIGGWSVVGIHTQGWEQFPDAGGPGNGTWWFDEKRPAVIVTLCFDQGGYGPNLVWECKGEGSCCEDCAKQRMQGCSKCQK